MTNETPRKNRKSIKVAVASAVLAATAFTGIATASQASAMMNITEWAAMCTGLGGTYSQVDSGMGFNWQVCHFSDTGQTIVV